MVVFRADCRACYRSCLRVVSWLFTFLFRCVSVLFFSPLCFRGVFALFRDVFVFFVVFVVFSFFFVVVFVVHAPDTQTGVNQNTRD